MECYQIKNLHFSYTDAEIEALCDLSFSIPKGAFVTLTGESGCGKTTLLRLLKPSLAPKGTRTGEILFDGRPLSMLTPREESAGIGFVLQSPDEQLVTDKVWHELAFGAESLGMKTPEIRAKVAEMASFFGMQHWFHKEVSSLSGGQKQILNLASILVMQPKVLLLDEPTSQLDPIAARDFLQLLHRVHKELGITVLLSEHRLEEALPLSDRVLVLHKGTLFAYDTPRTIAKQLRTHPIYRALPAPMQVAAALMPSAPSPCSVAEGIAFLDTYASAPVPARIPKRAVHTHGAVSVRMDNVSFRYEREGADVLRAASLTVHQGELLAILGGNGSGKTTLLSVLCGTLSPLRGKVQLSGRAAMLPQDPQTLFSKPTLRQELTAGGTDEQTMSLIDLCRLSPLLDRHPHDLSGGEQMRAALALLLLQSPDILLLDEPTRGMDAAFKAVFASILHRLLAEGVTVILVSHDLAFCARYAHTCALFFDGGIVSKDEPRAFFAGKSFYTTATNRMARAKLPTAILPEDVIAAYGGQPLPEPKVPDLPLPEKKMPDEKTPPAPKHVPIFRRLLGAISLVFCLGGCLLEGELLRSYTPRGYLFQCLSLLLLAVGLFCLLPHASAPAPRAPKHLRRHTLYALLFVLVAVPATLFWGLYALSDRKYYFISLLILLEIFLPFLFSFEHRKPKPGELLAISALCALTVMSRTVFYMLPQFKPVLALVILAGVAFGGEAGFLVGAFSAFLSNFFFGQGAWTPWQMFATGLVGFFAGIFFCRGFFRTTRLSLVLYGVFATFILYGGILNPSSVLLWNPHPTKALLLSSFVLGAPLDAIHALSTAVFLWFLAPSMLKKLERMRKKYDLFS